MSALIEARGATMRFGGVTAVDGVDFSIGEVELRCLIGPNGAGKSTFFKMLTGQLTPTAGRILFRGEDITGQNPHAIARRGIGIKTQVPNVFDGLPVRENVFVAASRRKSLATRGARSTRRWRGSTSLASPTAWSASSHMASGSGWRSRPCWRRSRI